MHTEVPDPYAQAQCTSKLLMHTSVPDAYAQCMHKFLMHMLSVRIKVRAYKKMYKKNLTLTNGPKSNSKIFFCQTQEKFVLNIMPSIRIRQKVAEYLCRKVAA
jgi:hypothetical protein